jgi:hypothetical protein
VPGVGDSTAWTELVVDGRADVASADATSSAPVAPRVPFEPIADPMVPSRALGAAGAGAASARETPTSVVDRATALYESAAADDGRSKFAPNSA